jgi:hypothetical protein
MDGRGRRQVRPAGDFLPNFMPRTSRLIPGRRLRAGRVATKLAAPRIMNAMNSVHSDTDRGHAWQPLTVALVLGACALTVLLRLHVIPAPWNLTPVGALALFAGARLRSWQAYLLPPLLMTLTNALLVVTADAPFWYFELPFVYGSLLAYVLLGRLVARSENPWAVGGAALAGSLQFFLVTNFATWLANATVYPAEQRLYSPDLTGLVACYAAGVPFHRGTLVGDLLFTAVLFGAHAWLTRSVFRAERVAPALTETRS